MFVWLLCLLLLLAWDWWGINSVVVRLYYCDLLFGFRFWIGVIWFWFGFDLVDCFRSVVCLFIWFLLTWIWVLDMI